MVKTDNIVLSDNKLMFLDPIACISNGRWDPALFNDKNKSIIIKDGQIFLLFKHNNINIVQRRKLIDENTFADNQVLVTVACKEYLNKNGYFKGWLQEPFSAIVSFKVGREIFGIFSFNEYRTISTFDPAHVKGLFNAGKMPCYIGYQTSYFSEAMFFNVENGYYAATLMFDESGHEIVGVQVLLNMMLDGYFKFV